MSAAMIRTTTRLLPIAAMLAIAGCAARYETITYPPRLDLSKHQTIGVVEFSSPDQKELASIVTSRFMESARSDQGLIRMITLHGGAARPTPDQLRALAKEHDLQTIVLGDLRVSKIRPSVSVADLTSASVSGAVEATLAVEIVDATGASLWSATGRTRETIGGVNVHDLKHVDFGGVRPDAAYTEMVDQLVGQVTRDMHSTWERRRVD
jgi:hypothetical protein